MIWSAQTELSGFRNPSNRQLVDGNTARGGERRTPGRHLAEQRITLPHYPASISCPDSRIRFANCVRDLMSSFRNTL